MLTLAMSDEIAQDEEEAEDYDLESLTHRTRQREDDDDATLVDGQRRGPESVSGDHVVFEIGDEDQEVMEKMSQIQNDVVCLREIIIIRTKNGRNYLVMGRQEPEMTE